MFAVEHVGVVPDILLLAKGIASGMPIGAVVASEEIMDWPAGAHGSTFGGNPVCCAAALATIDLLENGLVENAANMGRLLQEVLEDITAKHKCIANPRGLGLMAGVDVIHPRSGKGDANLRAKILQEAFTRGLILLPCGQISIRFCPPLCINQAQLETGLKVFHEAIATVKNF